MYGIDYRLMVIGKIVIISARSGNTDRALSAQDVLITLGAFDGSLNGKTFQIDIPTISTTNTTQRVGMVMGTGNITTSQALSSGTNLRFSMVGVIN